jgi:hypothetical protein
MLRQSFSLWWEFRRSPTCFILYITNITPSFLVHSCLHVLVVHTWVSEILDRSCDFWNSTCLFVPPPAPFLAISSTQSVWFLRVRDLVRVQSGENSNAFTVLFKLSYCCFCCLILDALICFLLEKSAFLLLFAFGFANSTGEDPVM